MLNVTLFKVCAHPYDYVKTDDCQSDVLTAGDHFLEFPFIKQLVFFLNPHI